MDDAPSNEQVIRRIFRRFQPRADQETANKKQDADKGSAYSHTAGKAYSPVEQVVQHDGIYNPSKRGASSDEAHCQRTTLAEIVRYYCHGRDIYKSLSYSEANSLGKQNLSFEFG